MKLTINGEQKDVELTGDATVSQLLERLGMAGRPVAVEHNRSIVPKREHDRATLSDGDSLELVTLVGGG